MELGQRIRQARLEQGLSQRQLCGQEITRNMLSQIENGSARPSMTTLQYLAARLEKPVSWFLEEQTVTSPNREWMEQARGAYAAGEYVQVGELLANYQGSDPVFDAEKYLLEALSLTAQAAAENRGRYAQKLLLQAREAGRQSVYYTPALEREWVLQMARVCDDKAAVLVFQLPEDNRELLLRARAAMEKEDWCAAICLLEATQSRDNGWHLQRGLCALGLQDYRVAAEHLKIAEPEFPDRCIPALETCYRELEDYKMAYQYACKHRGMTEYQGQKSRQSAK